MALATVIRRGHLMRYRGDGPSYTARFEAELGARIGVPHVLTLNSGTSALIAAYVAAGIGPGDEVLVPTYTWVATAAAALAVGAIPVLVNIDETLGLDPRAIDAKVTARTKAVVPVHMLNLVADLDPIVAAARRHGLVVIEDASQAVGVSYKGRRAGAIGDIGVFSFNQFKNISAGEGGALLTSTARYMTRASMYHDVGHYTREAAEEADEPVFAGVNFRVSELTSAVLHAQLQRLDGLLVRMRRRRRIVESALQECRHLRLTPHNDDANAVGLAVTFDDPERAARFAAERGVHHLKNAGRHIFRNWRPVVEKRTFDARSNPYANAPGDHDYADAAYDRTIDILGRTCQIALGENYPLPVVYAYAKRLARAAQA
jgi:dTDP-4-amino-4,6-dideoxygalactose transaminase